MKRLLIVFLLLCNVVVAQTELPPYVDIHITEYIQFYKYSNSTNDDAIIAPDSVSYEETDCHYVIDFTRGICEVYFQQELIGESPIIRTSYDGSKIIVKLADAADDTELVIDIQQNVFVYGYGFEMERIVTLPTKYTITSAKL